MADLLQNGQWHAASPISAAYLVKRRKLDRCKEAHIPDSVVYRSKSDIALEQIKRAVANGIRFDW